MDFNKFKYNREISSEFVMQDLIGKVITKVEKIDEEELLLYTDDYVYRMYHDQDCCEDVHIDDINGDLSSLVDTPVLFAEEVSSNVEVPADEYDPDSITWTFYKLATKYGWVDIRWVGESNGYYSEEVNLIKYDRNKLGEGVDS